MTFIRAIRFNYFMQMCTILVISLPDGVLPVFGAGSFHEIVVTCVLFLNLAAFIAVLLSARVLQLI